MNLFDILGPVMVGPSSSHTAGAARIGLVARALLDEEPVLDEKAIQLALWMRERYFCTVYDCVKAMLPAGLYFSLRDCVAVKQGVDVKEVNVQEVQEQLRRQNVLLP